VDVPVVPDCFIVNLGDLIDAEVSCIPKPGETPKYPATTGEHLRRLFVATQMSAAPQ
jgi:hypothetical protein